LQLPARLIANVVATNHVGAKRFAKYSLHGAQSHWAPATASSGRTSGSLAV